MRYHLPLTVLLLTGLFWACQPVPQTDKQLARVHNRVLYLSQLDGLFPEGTTREDSLIIIRSFTNRWIREALILHEAEQNRPDNLNIEQLVEDYRASLLKNSYEQVLVEQLLDSTITQQQLMDFYEKNKEQYQLETPIIRCHFVKAPIPEAGTDSLRIWWNRADAESLTKLETYCLEAGTPYILNDSIWNRLEEVAIELPKGTLTQDNVSSKKDFQQRDNEYQYFLKVFEVKNRTEIAPLGYIEEQARKVILHSRKLKLLQEKKEELYDLELRRNNIEVFME